MSWTLGIAIYFVIWWVLLFAILPFGIQSQHELKNVVPGTEPGAPAHPRLMLKLAVNTVGTALLLAIVDYFYIVYFQPH